MIVECFGDDELHQENSNKPDTKLTTEESKNLDDKNKSQIKRVLKKGEVHLRATALAANCALLLGCIARHTKFSISLEMLKKENVEIKNLTGILGQYLAFMKLTNGIKEDGIEVIEKIIEFFDSQS